MGWYQAVGSRVSFALDPETAHHLAEWLLGLPLPWEPIGGRAGADPALAVTLAGVELRNPIGLAAGFDKTCARMTPLGRLGFGHVVGGTVTLAPRPGNPRPRIARDRRHRALVNAMGLPNPGAAEVAATLARSPRTTSRWVSLADEAVDDVVAAFDLLAPHVAAVELNASSPNAGWEHLAGHVGTIVRELAARGGPPVFVKVPPPARTGGVLAMAEGAVAAGAAGLVVSNTIPVSDRRMSTGRGGLSGAPLWPGTCDGVRAVRDATAAAVPIVACGGIATSDHVVAALQAGATAIQLYTALVYDGPGVPGTLVRGLSRHLRATGRTLSSLATA